MSIPLSLDEQIERAQKVVQGWDDRKKSSMRLQGTDNFRERMAVYQKNGGPPFIKSLKNK